MNILINIIVTLIVSPWGGLVIMSPMMIASEGFASSKCSIMGAMGFFTYPVFVFLLLGLSGFRFYGTDPFWWAGSFFLMALLVIWVYGLPGKLINLGRGISNYGYFIKDNKVYLSGKQIKGADASSFTHFEERGYYSKDKNHVYYESKIIKGADANSFQPLANDDNYNYWHDKNNVYYNWHKLPQADGASFEFLGNDYAKDKNHVFFQDKLVEKADVNSFRSLKMHVGRDNDNVFVRTVLADNIKDLSSFEIIEIKEEFFGRDKEHIYAIFYIDKPITPFPNADIASFEVLGQYYAKDKSQVYYYSYHINKILVLKEANAQSFRLEYDHMRNTDATDGTNFYSGGRLYKEKSQ